MVQHKLNVAQVRIEHACSQPCVFIHGNPVEIQTQHPGTWSAAAQPLRLLCYHPAVFCHPPGILMLSFCQGIVRAGFKMPFSVFFFFFTSLALLQNCKKWILPLSRLPVHVEQLGFHWTDFHEIWYLCIFRKSAKKIQVTIKSDKNNGYFTWGRRCGYEYLAELLLAWEMYQKQVVAKIKTHILCSVTCVCLKLCLLWDNVGKFCRAGQPTDKNIIRLMLFACGKLRLQTYTQNMYYFLPSHGNNGYTNMPKCYFICTLPVLFKIA
jgi:hypothetical protein